MTFSLRKKVPGELKLRTIQGRIRTVPDLMKVLEGIRRSCSLTLYGLCLGMHARPAVPSGVCRPRVPVAGRMPAVPNDVCRQPTTNGDLTGVCWATLIS